MATIEQQGTKFTFSVLPLGLLSRGAWAKTEIAVQNTFVSYQTVFEEIAREDLEEWIFAMYRLLAGGYAKERNISFEKTGFAVDLYPYTQDGEEVSREERRKQDCVMAVRLLMKEKKSFLGGVYTVLLHRKEIESFANALRAEFTAAFSRFEKKKGKYLLVGVSPQGYKGCNYWYIDLKKTTKAGDYVWVVMGRHKTRQIVYVDSVRYCNDDTSPCDLDYLRTIERVATAEEVSAWKKTLGINE